MKEKEWIPIPSTPNRPSLVLPELPKEELPESGWHEPDNKFTEGFTEIEPLLINNNNGVLHIKGVIKIDKVPSKITLFSDNSLKEKNCFIEQPVGDFNTETYKTNATLYIFADGLCELSVHNKAPNEIIINTTLL